MGDRNLTMLKNKKGEKVIAQYAQWGAAPSCVGVNILSFLKDKELFNKLKDNLYKVRFLDPQVQDKEFYDNYLKNAPKVYNDSDNRTDEQKRWWDTYCHRNLAQEVLVNIANSTDQEIILLDREETAIGDGMVEFSYLIDLKENIYAVYTHLDKDPLKTYSLENLPTKEQFLDDLKEYEDEYME